MKGLLARGRTARPRWGLHPPARPSVLATALVALGLLVTVPAAPAPAEAPGGRGSGPPALAGTAVRVQGARLLRGGRPFVVHGLQIVGLVAPARALRHAYLLAHQRFGRGELEAARAFGANTVRFQISQGGLDPRSPLYSPGYAGEVKRAVALARHLGLAVILSLQAERPSGARARCALPTTATERDWRLLAPELAGDRGVLLELYNEPGGKATEARWSAWRSGGHVARSRKTVACRAIGMQRLVDTIRSSGARNVIIVPGLRSEETLAGMPALSDPAHQLAYGIHSPDLEAGPAAWARNFGARSARAPVIVTEWNASSTWWGCNAGLPREAAEFLSYLRARHIGIDAYAFDLPGTVRRGFGGRPTTYSHLVCGRPGAGPGQLLRRLFAGKRP